MNIIGLCGFAKSGKSTAARQLSLLGGVEVAFADHLKNVCSTAFSIPRHYFDDQDKKEIRFSSPIVLCDYDIAKILHAFGIKTERVKGARIFSSHSGKQLTSPRHVAQYIGTNLLRSLDTDIHIKTAVSMADKNAKFLIFSDVRFDNELEYIKKSGGYIFGIRRLSATPANLSSLHESEQRIPHLLAKCDFLLDNESSQDDFRRRVFTVGSALLEKMGVRPYVYPSSDEESA